MIDFRYHLVSLVSVFLALAVGIVLGAGPLKDSIGTELNKSIDSLRQQKNQLNEELNTANTALQHRDDFIDAVTPSLVVGQLTSRAVVLLSLPGVVEDDVDPLADAIINAGGALTGRVGVTSAWTDPAKAEVRTKVVTDLASALPTGDAPTTEETDVRLANLLAGALVGTGAGLVGERPKTSSTVLDRLRAADLIEIKGSIAGLAGGAMVMAPANAVDTAAGEVAPTKEALASYVSLAAAFDTASGGAVVSGPASSATDGGVVTAIRNDEKVRAAVSTVDSGLTPMGVITAILAMRDQLTGGSTGAYGFGNGAEELMPKQVAAVSAPTPSPSATKK